MTIIVDAAQNESIKALLRNHLIETLREMAVEKLVLVSAASFAFTDNATANRAQHLADASGLSMLATLIEAERSAMITSDTMDRLVATVRESTAFGKSKTFEGFAQQIEEMFN